MKEARELTTQTTRSWHILSVEEAGRSLECDLGRGLGESEVYRRRALYGSNTIDAAGPRPAVQILLGQFKDLMIAILVVAGVVAGLVGDIADTLAIGAIVILNAIVGFIQEYRSERAI